jgi:hypothetical protein
MNILERCETIQVEISRLESLDRASKEAVRDREHHDQIQPLRVRLQDAAQRAKALQQSGVTFPSWQPQPKLLAQFQDFARSVQDPETGKRNAYGTFKSALTALTDDASEQVKKTVDGLVVRNSDIDEPTLKRFDGVPALQAKLAATRMKRSEYLNVLPLRHRSSTDLLNFLSVRAALLSLTDELNHVDLPAEVRDFYQAVHSGRATIGMLTDPIRAWLETHDQLKDLRITFLPR